MLSYPAPALKIQARAAKAALPEGPRRALTPFLEWVEQSPLHLIEEEYAHALELGTYFQPYVGYHLFGESYRRSAFLVALAEHCRHHAYDPAPELCDHVACVLRLLSLCEHIEFRRDLIIEGLFPAVKRMLGEESFEHQKAKTLDDHLRADRREIAEKQAGHCPFLFPTATIDTQLKGVPDQLKEVKITQEKKQAHPYASVLQALDTLLQDFYLKEATHVTR